jgi:TolA-binding protein
MVSAANELIASLKSDLTGQSALEKQTRTLKKTIESRDAEITNLQAQISQLTEKLAEAQAENKAISTKLAASRAAAASVESASARIPGSAKKPNGAIRMVGSAEAAQTAQAASLKEDLYADLTSLGILGVKRESEEDVYDCIQTGRNGSMSSPSQLMTPHSRANLPTQLFISN